MRHQATTFALIASAALLSTSAFAQTATWQIDPAHTRASFVVRHLGISNVRGDFNSVSGTAEYDGKDITRAKINAAIDVGSLTTRVEQRDTHLKTPDFFDVARYPKMTFVSTAITPAGAGKFKMTGNLTLHGVTKPVTFDLDAPSPVIKDPLNGDSRVGAAATTIINRKDFKIPYDQKLPDGTPQVGDAIAVTIDIELLRAAK
jgi:polyisoprenoid-binding protein YceI